VSCCAGLDYYISLFAESVYFSNDILPMEVFNNRPYWQDIE